jgi:hypothetical protein
VKPAALLILGALGLTACAPKPPPPAPPQLAFDCARGYAALAAAIAAEPGLKLAPAPGEPYRYYSAEDGGVSYVVTERGAPAHPAVFKQVATPHGTDTIGCPYGDGPGYGRFAAYLRDLAKARRGR